MGSATSKRYKWETFGQKAKKQDSIEIKLKAVVNSYLTSTPKGLKHKSQTKFLNCPLLRFGFLILLRERH